MNKEEFSSAHENITLLQVDLKLYKLEHVTFQEQIMFL
jgi:hypothetical protein